MKLSLTFEFHLYVVKLTKAYFICNSSWKFDRPSFQHALSGNSIQRYRKMNKKMFFQVCIHALSAVPRLHLALPYSKFGQWVEQFPSYVAFNN